MARDSQGALIALNRFGLGARGGAAGDLANAASDPRGFVQADMMRPNGAMLEAPGLQASPDLAFLAFDFQQDKKQDREAAKQAQARMPGADMPGAPKAPADNKDKTAGDTLTPNSNVATGNPAAPNSAEQQKLAPQPPNIIQKTYRVEGLARLQRANMVECGFTERLVGFWSNHFCISANKGPLARIWAGAFEREAIRPHVLGHFGDMVRAVEQHPAMLFFLDNQQSLGPESRAGQNRKKGLNENLAREIMELHTLGVGGGYTQTDVTTLARIITGWSFAGREGRLGTPGTFIFNVNAHEPGPQTLLGKVYEDTGVTQGEQALADIARHPSTAKFVTQKFARHFIADDPPRALLARLEGVFKKTNGDLKALSQALIDSDEAWSLPMTKIRTPYEFLVASGRVMANVPEDPNRYLGALNVLGQPLWTPPGPNGFPDSNAAWAAPEGMKLRLDIASRIASRLPDDLDPRNLLEAVAGDAASKETRETIDRAESRQQAVALLLMSPEFQRR